MVREVATGRSRVVCVVGLAGAGKTTATHAVAQLFAHAGIDVLGAAPSGVAAEKLQDETGIPSATLHRLLEHARDAGLPHRSVLVVDEAAMAETRVLAPVLELVEQAQGKAILIGDPQQLPAVGAGGLFAGIVEREGAVVLRENRRQRDPLEHDALARVRAGVGRDYLAYAEKHERLVVSDSPVTTRARLLADWWQYARDDLAGNVVLALRRRDVADLNQLARQLMDADGRLGKERLRVAEREFAAGDRVVCLRNSDLLGVKNGTTGTVERVDSARRTLAVATDRGPTVELNRRYLQAGDVRHAYALTGHAAPRAHRRARLRPWRRRSTAAGMGLRRPLPRPRPRPRPDPPLHHRHAARAGEPLPPARRPRPAHPLRPRARRIRDRATRPRPTPAPIRAQARGPP
jgi:ATP-dependent exoDNAse (exonuclease V) alpha subunit